MATYSRVQLMLVFAGGLGVSLAACGGADADLLGPSPEQPNLELVASAATHPTGQAIHTVALGSDPFGAAITPQGEGLVTQLFASQVSVFAVAAEALLGAAPVGQIPTDVEAHPNGTRAYVTNQLSQNVGVINLATRQQIATIAIAGDPFRVLLNRSGSRLYVSSNGDNITVVDTRNNARLATIPVGLDPNGLALSSSERFLFVTNQSDGTVSRIDLRTNRVVRTYVVGGQPQEIVLAPTGGLAYIANQAGDLQVLSLESGQIVRAVTFGGAPFAMAMTPDQAQLYLATTLSGQIHVLDRASLATLQTITTNGLPRRIAFTQSGDAAIIADQVAGVVFVK